MLPILTPVSISLLPQLLKTSDAELDDDDDAHSDNGDALSALHDNTVLSKSTIFSSGGSGVPLRRRAGYNYSPTWLRTNSQIYANPAHLRNDTMSLHILDQGYGPNALLTVRQIDPEKQQKRFTLEQQSRSGILGRIISGVWAKVAEVRYINNFVCLARCFSHFLCRSFVLYLI